MIGNVKFCLDINCTRLVSSDAGDTYFHKIKGEFVAKSTYTYLYTRSEFTSTQQNAVIMSDVVIMGGFYSIHFLFFSSFQQWTYITNIKKDCGFKSLLSITPKYTKQKHCERRLSAFTSKCELIIGGVTVTGGDLTLGGEHNTIYR